MLKPAISFQGNCDEAINFYKEALGAEIICVEYLNDEPSVFGMGKSTPQNFVYYSEVSIYGSTIIMADGGKKPLEGFWMQLVFDTEEKVTAVFNKLAEGGKIVEPLSTDPYGCLMGTVNDRFGVPWNVSIYFE